VGPAAHFGHGAPNGRLGYFPGNYFKNYPVEKIDPRELHIGFFGRQNEFLKSIYLTDISALCARGAS
jgi:hypothetical protein